MRTIIYFVVMALLAAACNKQIDAIQPLTRIDKAGELSTVAGIVETTVGNYTLLNGNQYSSFAEPLLDIGEARGNNVTLQQFTSTPVQQTDAFFFQNSNSATLGYSSNFYRSSYQIIVSCNATLEGIMALKANLSSLSGSDQASLLYAEGENRLIRAFVYFNLVRVYGKPYYQSNGGGPGVPIKTSSSGTNSPAVSNVHDVYAFVVSELQTAASLMKAPVTKDNAFASTAAAWALLSRVYLYMGGSVASPEPNANQLAVAYADSVIDQTGGVYSLLQGNDYANMFGDDGMGNLGRSVFSGNTEIIWALDAAIGGTNIGELFHYDQTYGVGAYFLPGSDFKSLFSPADVRGSFVAMNPASGFVETTKWLCLNQAWLTYAPVIYLRLGETYLNRAEAEAKTGDFTDARSDLKTIHVRAGLPGSDIDGLADADVLNAVLLERRMELAFEGHASFDYFRNGLPMSRTASDNNGNAVTVAPDDPKVEYTIPNY